MNTPPTPLHIERTGPKTYIGRNARGGEVCIGGTDADDALAPGELLALALAACGLLSTDHTLAGRLGEDFAAIVDVTPRKTDDGQRYDLIAATIRTNMSALDEEKITVLTERAERAIDRLCTIGHTLDHGAEHPVTLRHDPDLPEHL
ncbi:osmotically inducible protein OsmC [Intrasporangium chromatireducens Q5-1]|uniref:Osmotically inducible protein OsmC n=1 Tax=Intrasporangium chromatireducens Q5-1 TaxID=584657 RepID=W9GTC3_9MICO|nr:MULTISPECIES: OsmC family protein [Actinomycetes]EWT07129.1 osmotically inducible protein OsmC [Intrasporangium chromatireducens Q5-1]